MLMLGNNPTGLSLGGSCVLEGFSAGAYTVHFNEHRG